MKWVSEVVQSAKPTNAQASSVLRIVDSEVLLKTAKSGGGDVVPVQVIHNVDEDEKRASGVQLPLQPLLDVFSSFGIHLACLVVRLDRLQVP